MFLSSVGAAYAQRTPRSRTLRSVGAIISPGSAPDDGLAELQLVSKPSFLPLLKAFYDVYTNRAVKSRHVRTIVGREAQVHQEGTLAHLDGEPVEIGHEVRFRLEPKRLWVLR